MGVYALKINRRRQQLLVNLFLRKHINIARRHDSRNRVFINKLNLSITTQKNTKIVKPCDIALKLYAVHQKYSDGDFAFP